MSGSTRAAEPGSGAAEIAAEPQSLLPNLPPLLTAVQGRVCRRGGIFQNENIVYKNDPLMFNQKIVLMQGFLTKIKVAASDLQIQVQVMTIGKELGPLEGTAMIFLKKGRSSDMIPDDRTFPDLFSAVQKLGLQGTGGA